MTELETYWSGSLERSGQVPGLSTYQGRSQLVGAFEREEEPPIGKKWRQALGVRVANGSLDPVIKVLLAKGISIEEIARRLQCSPNVVRRVRKQWRA